MSVEATRSRLAGLRDRMQVKEEQDRALRWEGSFFDYLDLVKQNPSIASLAHRRSFDALLSPGVETTIDGKKRYEILEHGEFFGAGRAVEQLAQYLESAGNNSELRKRAVLLMGPPGGGKTKLISLLKEALEKYTRTDKGAVYAIKGCPMHESPLHLIPEEERSEIAEELGVHIEGSLCPHCQERVREHGIESVRVERIVFSEKERRGIARRQAGEQHSQAENVLYMANGHNGETPSETVGYDTEYHAANGGILEFSELLKIEGDDEKNGLLAVTQEQIVKVRGKPPVYADIFIIASCNQPEYEKFLNNPNMGALRDRMVVIEVPSAVKMVDEVKIQESMLRNEVRNTGVHVAPQALEIAAMVAVATRIEEPKRGDLKLLEKVRLYNGETVKDFTDRDAEKMQEAAPREGMSGLTTRFVNQRLSTAVAREVSAKKEKPSEQKCINALDVLRSLREGVERDMSLKDDQKRRYLSIIEECRKEFDAKIIDQVQRAFVEDFEGSAETLFQAYREHSEAYLQKKKLKDPFDDEAEIEPDEKFMRSIEEAAGISENSKRTFREEVHLKIAVAARRERAITYATHPGLRKAIEAKLLGEVHEVVKLVTTTKTPDAEQLKKINQAIDQLTGREAYDEEMPNGTKKHHKEIAGYGYCPCCAREILKYAGPLLTTDKKK